jgi:4-amino-4-deoxy-L-arabinose transferase-like glycosyltransferase
VAIVLFIVSLVIVSYVAFCIFVSVGNKTELGKNLFLAITTVLISTILIATVLAIFGFYSLLVLGICLMVAGCIGLFILMRLLPKTINVYEYLKTWKWWHWVVCGIVIISAVLYLGFPVKYVVGGRDPGLYVVIGVSISNNGGMQLPEDEFLTENSFLVYENNMFVYPGVFSAKYWGLSENAGDMVFQFLPMLPAALAIGYDIGGLEGLLRIPGIIGIVALLAIFFFTKTAFGVIPAILATAFMLINPAQLWGARITQTELLSQLLFILAAYAFLEAWRKDSTKLSILAGFLIGIGGLCRIDVYILGPAVSSILIYAALFNRKRLTVCVHLFWSTMVFFAISLLHGFLLSYPYFQAHWDQNVLRDIVVVNIVFALPALVCLIVSRVMKQKVHKNLITDIFNSKAGCILFCALLFAVFLYAYFIRPMQNPGNFRANAMVEFSWYTSFIAIALAIPGIYFSLKKDFHLREEVFLFLLIGLSSMIVYTYNPAVTPDHIWASRRWITVNIPFILIFAAYGIYKLYEVIRLRARYIAIVVFCLCSVWIFGYLTYQSAPFITTTMLRDINRQYSEAIENMDKEAVYFTPIPHVSIILHFVYGFDVYEWGMSLDIVTEKLGFEDRDIYYIVDQRTVPIHTVNTLMPVSAFNIGGDFLDWTRRAYSRDVIDWTHKLLLFEVIEKIGNDVIGFEWTHPFLMYLPSRNKNMDFDDKLVSNGEPDFLVFGPYVSLDKGHYEVTFDINLYSPVTDEEGYIELGFIDVMGDIGTVTILEPTLITSENFTTDENNIYSKTITLAFTLLSDVEFVEFRMFTYEGVILGINRIALTME